uniref:BCL2 interacting killer n=1 Tax=Ursus americanus TaxID=9643 RepID=A0A452QUG1_URSAM
FHTTRRCAQRVVAPSLHHQHPAGEGAVLTGAGGICQATGPLCNNPDDVAMRLAFIGDEMEVRWMLPRVGELPGMAMYSLAFTYNQTGLRGVLRSLMDGLTNLRENIRIWSFLTFRNRVSPHPGRRLVLSLLLLLGLLLGWGFRLLQ